jgi:RNA polymerase sigma-70 factor, ECF subfamily
MDTSPDAGQTLEAQWVSQTANGDRAAFERLFHAYEHRLYRYVLGMVRDPRTAEEVTGDVLLEVWKSAGKFRGQSKVSTWIFGIAHHKAVDALRRHVPEHVELGTLTQRPDVARGPEETALATSDRRAVSAALEELTPEHRAVIELTFLNGYSQAEIAAIVRCPINTVKTRVFYAKQQLRRILERRGVRSERQ